MPLESSNASNLQPRRDLKSLLGLCVHFRLVAAAA